VKEVVKEVPVEKVVYQPAPFDPQLVGICTFANKLSCDLKTKTQGNPLRVTNICDQMLRQASELVRAHPGTVIKLIGNENESEREHNSMYALARAKNVERQLLGIGVSKDLIVSTKGNTGDRTVEVWVVLK